MNSSIQCTYTVHMPTLPICGVYAVFFGREVTKYTVHIHGVYAVFLVGKSPNIRCIYTVLANPTHLTSRFLIVCISASTTLHDSPWVWGDE